MITGTVMPVREAIVRIRVQGPPGQPMEVDAVIDTGFTEYLTLPRATILALALRKLFTDRVTLADGSVVAVELYECTVDWDGRQRLVTVHCLDGSPLIGMSLLWDHRLTMQVLGGGSVTINPIP